MFDLLAYIFKTIIALGTGYLIGYSNQKQEKSSLVDIQLYTSLSSFFVSTIIGIFSLNDEVNYIVIAIIFFAVVQFIISNNNKFNLIENYKVLFATINGLLIGLGFVFYSIIVTIVFSYITNNFDIIIALLNKEASPDNQDDIEKNDIDINNE